MNLTCRDVFCQRTWATASGHFNSAFAHKSLRVQCAKHGEAGATTKAMKIFVTISFCGLLLLFAANVRAQDEEKPQDAEGCKDSPLITRFPGSIIHSCDNKEYEQA